MPDMCATPDTSVVVKPTDVWVCLRTGAWNLTNPNDADVSPSRINRAIMRGLLQAAIEALDEMDAAEIAAPLMGRSEALR